MRLLILFQLLSTWASAQTLDLFIGTYTNTGSKGIYVYTFNVGTGRAVWKSNTDSVSNPSFLALSKNGEFFRYSVNETGGADSGKVSAFSYDKRTGKLNFINQQNSGGDHPCHISLNKSNHWILASNYTGGSITAIEINKDGSLQPYAQNIKNSGNSIVKPNQEHAHVHGSFFSPDEKQIYVTDLGIDKIMMYDFHATSASPLTPRQPAHVQSQPGSGPRHLTFHPNGSFAYVIQELSGTIAVYKLQGGTLESIQHVSAHPNRYIGRMASADIHISPDGKFLYASNRGDANTIAIFSVNKETGMITTVDHQSTHGKAPRNFAIDLTGNFLLVANQDSDNIVVFRRNKKTGRLSPTGEEVKLPRPVFLMFSR